MLVDLLIEVLTLCNGFGAQLARLLQVGLVQCCDARPERILNRGFNAVGGGSIFCGVNRHGHWFHSMSDETKLACVFDVSNANVRRSMRYFRVHHSDQSSIMAARFSSKSERKYAASVSVPTLCASAFSMTSHA